MAFGLPAIDTIKDLLTGSITDKLKEFIEPFALVNAGIFLILNLALVFPLLDPFRGDQFIASIFGLSGAWLAVLGALTVLLLSYVINNLNGFFLDLMSGEVFRKTPGLSQMLLKIQRRRFRGMNEALGIRQNSSNDASSPERELKQEELDQLAFQRAYEFPVNEEELGLARLGNLLVSPSSYVWQQYGASAEIVWPILHESLGDDNKLVKPVQESWNSMQFFITLAVLLLIVMLEVLLVGLYGNQLTSWAPWLQMIFLLFGASLAYYLASQKARRWGSAFRRVFDSNLDTALEQLGMEALKKLNPSDKSLKESWQKISGWLAYGAITNSDDYKPDGNWYKDPSEVKWPQVSHPEFLAVDQTSYYEVTATASQDPKIYECQGGLTYRFALSNVKANDNPASGRSAYLILKDKQLIPGGEPAPAKLYINSDFGGGGNNLGTKVIEVKGEWETADVPAILFPLGNIFPGNSRILRFENKVKVGILTLDHPEYIKQVRIVKEPERYQCRLTPTAVFTAGSSLVVSVSWRASSRLELGENALYQGNHRGTLENSNRKGTWTIKCSGGENEDIVISFFRRQP
jgi:hypothetical protein